MNSNIKNTSNQFVERLETTFKLVGYGNSSVTGAQSSAILLKKGSMYTINCIRLKLLYFINSGTGVLAFPHFEQYEFDHLFDLYIGPAVAVKTYNLIKALNYTLISEDTNTPIFNQPFVFQTDTNVFTNLILQVAENNSQFSSISLMPPGIGNFMNVYGQFTFEGTSMPLSSGQGIVNKDSSTLNPEADKNYNIPNPDRLY